MQGWVLRAIVGLATGMVRASQRAPAVATGAVLIVATAAIAATSFPAAEPLVIGAMAGFVQLADALPYVNFAPYLTEGEDGSITFSTSGDAGDGVFRDVLAPIYAYLTGALLVFRWVTRVRPSASGFWSRFQPTVLLVVVCLVVFAASAVQRQDVAGITGVFAIIAAAALVTAVWGSVIAGAMDAVERRMFPNAFSEA